MGDSGVAGALPQGTVTFLFTDLEGSARLLEAHPAAYRDAVARHHALLREAVEGCGGVVFETVGDAVYAAFTQATDAVAAALTGQLALQEEDWGAVGPLRARTGVHPGEAERQGAHYFGAPLYRCARLMATAHGGQVVLSEVAAGLVREALPAGAALRDLGEHRLKDLQRPERIFQLLHPGLPADFPPLRTLDARSHNLPVQVTSFVGREGEVAAVTQRLAGARLVTLTGPGGVGKTRLALEVAGGLPDGGAYPDGVWLVDLAPLADGALVPRAALAAVGGREGPGRPPLDALVAHLRPRAVLLVLDNCEHLLDACATLGEALLGACPRVRLLATSREPLGLAGEAAWPVPPLPVPALPDPGAAAAPPPDPAALARYAAVRLFADRAAAARPAFALDAGNAAAVAAVCARLDGLPLALELAAARVRVLPPPALLARLEDRFRLLTGGSRTALPRQQTLQATVDWSYALLSEAERAVLRRLAVFAGGWTLEAAETVCAGEPLAAGEVLDRLIGLVDKSLVIAEVDPEVDPEVGAGGPRTEARYRLLETIRQYAEGRLRAAGEAAAVRDRHRDWYAAVARPAGGGSLQRAETRTHARRLEREQDNLRTALAWCRDSAAGGDGARLGLQLASDLHVFWAMRVAGEGLGWLETFLDRWREPDAVRAQGLCALALWRLRHGDLAPARALQEAAVAIARALGDRLWLAQSTRLLGLEAATRGDYAAAGAAFAESVATARALGDRGLTAHGLIHLGMLRWWARDYGAARALLDESLALARTLSAEPHAIVAMALLNLGLLDRLEGDLAASRARVGESVALLDAIDGPGGYRASMARDALGSLALAEGRPDEARAVFAGVLRRWEGAVFPLDVRDQLSLFGVLAAAEGQHARAARLLAAGAAIAGRPGSFFSPDIRVEGEDALARVRAALGEAAFAAATADGQALPLERAIAYALESVPPRPAAAGAAVRLTPRETEVAALLGRCATNRAIAAQLVISERTAKRHVENILRKLGLRSRAQVAEWARRRGVLPAG